MHLNAFIVRCSPVHLLQDPGQPNTLLRLRSIQDAWCISLKAQRRATHMEKAHTKAKRKLMENLENDKNLCNSSIEFSADSWPTVPSAAQANFLSWPKSNGNQSFNCDFLTSLTMCLSKFHFASLSSTLHQSLLYSHFLWLFRSSPSLR